MSRTSRRLCRAVRLAVYASYGIVAVPTAIWRWAKARVRQ
jgi:hypothetical protein